LRIVAEPDAVRGKVLGGDLAGFRKPRFDRPGERRHETGPQQRHQPACREGHTTVGFEGRGHVSEISLAVHDREGENDRPARRIDDIGWLLRGDHRLRLSRRRRNLSVHGQRRAKEGPRKEAKSPESETAHNQLSGVYFTVTDPSADGSGSGNTTRRLWLPPMRP